MGSKLEWIRFTRARLRVVRIRRIAALVLTAAIVLAPMPAATGFPALLSSNGQLDFTYGSLVDSDGGPASGQKPESKLFYTQEGSPQVVRWWAVLGTSGPSPAPGLHLWELVDHTWVPRVQLPGADPWAKADTVFDGATLYVSARDNRSSTTDNPRRSALYQLPYLGSGSWGAISGPFTITTSDVETLTIAKDSQGRIWTAFESSGAIRVGSTAPGGTSFTFTAISQTNVDSDDIAAVTAFGGDKIGVFWSDQASRRDLFAWRSDADPVTSSWTVETAYGGGVGGCPTASSDLCADDHVNVKVYGDEVYVAIKTGLDVSGGASSDPLIALLRRSANGTWSSFPVSTVAQAATRPITVLSPDQDAIRVWATRGSEVDVWESSLSTPGFTSTQFVRWVKGESAANNATSTKQPTTSATGTVVEVSLEKTYQAWHNEFLPTGVTPAPSVTGFSPSSGPVGTSVAITGTGFAGASRVTFGPTNVTASFTVVSDTQIAATVPQGAATGPISVTTPGGTATSPDSFAVTIPPPSITGFSPSSGPVGAPVTISGSAFTGATQVTFGPTHVAASFTVVSDTQITATVPQGAATGRISVTTPEGAGTSSASFSVTVTFGLDADAELRRSSPDANFGTQSSISVDNNPVQHGLLRFTVDVGNRSIAGVKLRLYCVDASPVGGTFFATGTSWAENTVTWNNAPALGSSYGALRVVKAGAWYEVDLTALVQGNGTYSVRITTSSSNNAAYATNERGGGLVPQVVVAVGT